MNTNVNIEECTLVEVGTWDAKGNEVTKKVVLRNFSEEQIEKYLDTLRKNATEIWDIRLEKIPLYTK